MPDEELWESFFDPAAVLRKLGLTSEVDSVVEFGCGYGTFTIPAAHIVRGVVHAIDIEPEMVRRTQVRAEQAGLTNVRPAMRDFSAAGTGLPAGSVNYAMLFNLLHCEEPLALLKEARRVLAPGGLLGVMHWRHDPTTPRGPSMEIRPRPQQCLAWCLSAGFACRSGEVVDLPPFHYGMTAQKPHSSCMGE
jgi:ubiquinone/menaquinone biosynthesis C-methylase UbiE